jgi:hypothetical protein
MNENQLARNLALFSVGLGLAELVAPRKVARLVGIEEDHDCTLQMLGLRELTSGFGIMQGKPAYFLWSRVAGDIMDLAFLGRAMKSGVNDRRRLQGAMAAVGAVTVVDLIASLLHSRRYEEPGWRDPRSMESRGAIRRGDPSAMRAVADDAMGRYQQSATDERSSETAARSTTLPG